MQNKFDAKAFEPKFIEKLGKLNASERITKELVREMSREVLEAHIHTEDIGYINRFINVLTPMNKKTAILFYQAFSGFQFNMETGLFGKKDKQKYEAKKQLSIEFLNDPLNNLWSWAERNVELQAKPFDINVIGKTFQTLTKKAKDAGFTQKDVIREVLKDGVELNTILELLDELHNLEVKVD